MWPVHHDYIELIVFYGLLRTKWDQFFQNQNLCKKLQTSTLNFEPRKPGEKCMFHHNNHFFVMPIIHWWFFYDLSKRISSFEDEANKGINFIKIANNSGTRGKILKRMVQRTYVVWGVQPFLLMKFGTKIQMQIFLIIAYKFNSLSSNSLQITNHLTLTTCGTLIQFSINVGLDIKEFREGCKKGTCKSDFSSNNPRKLK